MRGGIRLAAALCAALLAALPAAAAPSPGELRVRARAIGGATGDAAVEQQRVAALGELVLAFIAVSDEAARNGSDRARRDELRGAFEAIDTPLESIYAARSGRLEALARGVMDQDGDLEALYESKAFTESQAVAAAALYYRNWLKYYGARLVDGARRTALLTAAEQGFSEFAVGDQQAELVTESLLGRGLCHLELGDTEAALRDFELVLEAPGVSPERQAKTRLARLDAYGRAGRTQDALRYSDEILRGGGVPAADLTLVRFVRLQTLFDAADKAKGAEAERHRREAAALMDSLRAAGKGWADRVDALLVSRVDDPRDWAGKTDAPRAQWELARLMLSKNDFEGATPLLTQIVASSEADAEPLKPEAQYWLGVAAVKRGEPAAAADAFDAALAADGEWAPEARYLRFKALESLMAQPDVAPPLAARYEAAVREVIARAPDHPQGYEAHYRLGEYLQSRGDFAGAIDAYAAVQGDPATELRARFGTVQSRFELLKTDVEPAARGRRLDAIGADLDAVDAQRRALGQPAAADAALEELGAKATLLRAVYLSLRAAPQADEQVAALLADFDQQFPTQQALLPQAVRLRLGALLPLNRYADAEQAVARFGPALAAEGRGEQLEGLADGFGRAAARRKAEGDAAGSEAAARTALALYGLLGPETGTARRLAIAQLKENGGDPGGAADEYRAVIEADPNALLALRGLARVEEARGRTAEALAHWVTYTQRSRPGDLGWFQGEYQQARLTLVRGDKAAACERLQKLRPAMPGLTDADLRRQLGELHTQACG